MYLFIVFLFGCVGLGRKWVIILYCRDISDWIFEGSLKIIWICCLGRIFNDIDEYIVMYGLK